MAFTLLGAFAFSRDIAGVRELVAMNSRRYAKRQITFFSSLPGAQWVNADEGLGDQYINSNIFSP
jgi:tRNA dimethylallyltransferase